MGRSAVGSRGKTTAKDQVKVRLSFGLDVTATARHKTFHAGSPVNVFVKPEAISLILKGVDSTDTVNSFEGSILQRSYEGALLRYKAVIGDEQIDIYAINTSENRFEAGTHVRIHWAPEGVIVIDAEHSEGW